MRPDNWTDDDVSVSVSGPGTDMGPISLSEVYAEDFVGPELYRATLDMPGDWRVEFSGSAGCRSEFAVRTQLDTTLRAFDARHGLTQPPPPSGER